MPDSCSEKLKIDVVFYYWAFEFISQTLVDTMKRKMLPATIIGAN